MAVAVTPEVPALADHVNISNSSVRCEDDARLVIISVGYGYVLPVLCLCGILLNSLIICAFCHGQLRHFPLYTLMISLSVVDVLMLTVFLPTIVSRCSCAHVCPLTLSCHESYMLWVYSAKVMYPVTNTWSTAGMWIITAIAAERYLFVKHRRCGNSPPPAAAKPGHRTKLANSRRTIRYVCVIIILLAIVFHVPLFFEKDVACDRDSEMWTASSRSDYIGYGWCRVIFAQIVPAVTLIMIFAALTEHLWAHRKICGHGATTSLYYYTINKRVTQMVAWIIVVFLLLVVQTGFTTNEVVYRTLTDTEDRISYRLVALLGDTLEITSKTCNFFIYYNHNRVFRYRVHAMLAPLRNGIKWLVHRAATTRVAGRNYKVEPHHVVIVVESEM